MIALLEHLVKVSKIAGELSLFFPAYGTLQVFFFGGPPFEPPAATVPTAAATRTKGVMWTIFGQGGKDEGWGKRRGSGERRGRRERATEAKENLQPPADFEVGFIILFCLVLR